MRLRAWLRHPRARPIAIGVATAIGLAVARWVWWLLARHHAPHVYYDTQIYEQIAARPLGVELLWSPKPLLVPLVFRAVGSDRAAILAIHENLAFVAWALFAASLACAMRRRWMRAVAIAVGVAFAFAPTRIGYTASLLSESIADSLFALVAACAIALVWLPATRPRARRAAMIALAVLIVLWVLTRDTNAVVIAIAAAAAMAVWRGWRSRRAWAACAGVAAIFVLTMWCMAQEHPLLPYQANWDVRFTPRTKYPLLDNLTRRASSEFPPDLAPLVGKPEDASNIVEEGDRQRPLRDWIIADGQRAYLRWLVRHPVDRAAEVVGAAFTILVNPNTAYMPEGWDAGTWLRGFTQIPAVVVLLMAAAPFALWRPRKDPLRALALVMLASGLVGAVAAYFGDANEVRRHCYGAGQQIVLALFVAALARADALLTRRASR